MTRIARRAVLIASLVIAATAIAVAHGVGRSGDGATAPSATERYDAYDGGPVPIRKLYEPVEPIVVIGLPREDSNRFGIAHAT